MRDVETSKRDPEAPERAESSATERISTHEPDLASDEPEARACNVLFNASDELHKTTVGKCGTQDDVRCRDPPDLDIVPREHKGSETESKHLLALVTEMRNVTGEDGGQAKVKVVPHDLD